MHFSSPLRWVIRNHLTMSGLPEIYQGQLTPFPDFREEKGQVLLGTGKSHSEVLVKCLVVKSGFFM